MNDQDIDAFFLYKEYRLAETHPDIMLFSVDGKYYFKIKSADGSWKHNCVFYFLKRSPQIYWVFRHCVEFDPYISREKLDEIFNFSLHEFLNYIDQGRAKLADLNGGDLGLEN